MCGIAGIVGEVTPRLVAGGHEMLHRLEHRGPDDHGWLIYTRNQVMRGQGRPPESDVEALLLHRRLAILDLTEAGRQPMTDPGGRFHIVFNGEIYNYLKLRQELQVSGASWRTETDTEVLLRFISARGPAALTRLVGMFAFAVLDGQTRTLLLARDPYGIKPLYYSVMPTAFAFASEIKALLALECVSRDVHPERLFSYLSAGSTDRGDETMLRDVRQVPPGHYLLVDLEHPSRATPIRYYEHELVPPLDVSFAEAVNHTRDLFLESVALHMRSDVPVGATLSGGVDSSANVMTMRGVLGPAVPIHAFSFITENADSNDESWIDLMGKASGAVVHKVRPSAPTTAADFDAFVTIQDEPVGGPSVYAQYLVYREARATGVKVVLNGQGADELFAGYDEFLVTRWLGLLRACRFASAARFYRRAIRHPEVAAGRGLRRVGRRLVPRPWSGALLHLGQAGRAGEVFDAGWFERRGVRTGRSAGEHAPSRTRELAQEMLFSTRVPMLLRYEDRNAMAFGVENRVPFLTPPLVEFVSGLPEEFLVSPDGVRKHVLREALRGIVPDPVLDRRQKVGFQRPRRSSLLGLLPAVQRMLAADNPLLSGPLRRGHLRRQWDEVVQGRRHFDYAVWRWVNVLRWAEALDLRVSD